MSFFILFAYISICTLPCPISGISMSLNDPLAILILNMRCAIYLSILPLLARLPVLCPCEPYSDSSYSYVSYLMALGSIECADDRNPRSLVFISVCWGCSGRYGFIVFSSLKTSYCFSFCLALVYPSISYF